MLLRDELAQAVGAAVEKAQAAGALPQSGLAEVRVERPRDREHGDYASPVALKLAGEAKMRPLEIARIIISHLTLPLYISNVEVLPPGFINFWLADAFLQNLVADILAAGKDYGRVNIGEGRKALVEFVSANPTGPITVGRTRGGVIGDALARILEQAGYSVVREYYFNDAGRQIVLLGESVQIRCRQLLGEDTALEGEHYQGEYIVALAKELVERHGRSLMNQPVSFFSDYAKAEIAQAQRASLKRINIAHDIYFNEQSLFDSGELWKTLERLRSRGYVYTTADGAQWLKTTEFGDEKDRIIIRSVDGRPTYRLPDIAYHVNKLQRGFDIIVDVFGPDHLAVADQVLMGVRMLDYEADRIYTLIHQIVRLVQAGEMVKMSTRSGDYVTLDELVDEVGADAVRYFMLSRSSDSMIDFDLDLALARANENPVYYIQNAHVRCAGIMRQWEASGFADGDTADLSLLNHDKALSFLRKALEMSEVVELAATLFEPHRLTTYAMELATAFHAAYEQCRVLGEGIERPLQLARLRFYQAAQQALANVLALMGMSAPNKM